MQGSQRLPSSCKEYPHSLQVVKLAVNTTANPVMLPLKGTISSYITEGLHLSSFPLSHCKSHAWTCGLAVRSQLTFEAISLLFN